MLAKVADFVTICLTCFSSYLVLLHCRSRWHLTRPLARVWPVLWRVLEVAIALGSWDLCPSGRLVFLFLFFFRLLGFSGSSGSLSSEGEAEVMDRASLSEGSPLRSLEP